MSTPLFGPLCAEPIAGARLHLRPVSAADLEALTGLYADPTVNRWWNTRDPATEARDHVEPEANRIVWVIEVDGAVAGIIQAWEEPNPEYRHAGIDLALRGDVQGRGLGPEAIRVVARWLFKRRGHHRLTIDPRADNANAIRAYAKAGFRPVGVMRAYERDADGRWHDGLLMELLVGELVDG